MKVEKKSPGVLSLFTGCGGLDLGFEAAGFEVLCCVENSRFACNTLRLNDPKLAVMGPADHEGNIKTIKTRDIVKFAKIQRKDIDVIIGGPPCQPFSVAASQRFLKSDSRFKRLGFKDELRGTLLFDYIRLIGEIRPKCFLMENVPGFLTADGGSQLRICLKQLHDLGYKITGPTVINAADYGVPQVRKRLLIFGTKTGLPFAFPTPTYSQTGGLCSRPWNTVAHALVDMPQQLPNHLMRSHSEGCISRYRKLDFGEREHLGRVDRLSPYQPSKTVIAGGSNGGGRSHLHPFIARTLSVRECARLQTFPDHYIFSGPVARQFTQVGNAVPPLLAEMIARQIMSSQFGVKPSAVIQHLKKMEKSESIEELVSRLEFQSRRERPEWIYLSHAATKVSL